MKLQNINHAFATLSVVSAMLVAVNSAAAQNGALTPNMQSTTDGRLQPRASAPPKITTGQGNAANEIQLDLDNSEMHRSHGVDERNESAGPSSTDKGGFAGVQLADMEPLDPLSEPLSPPTGKQSGGFSFTKPEWAQSPLVTGIGQISPLFWSSFWASLGSRGELAGATFRFPTMSLRCLERRHSTRVNKCNSFDWGASWFCYPSRRTVLNRFRK